MIENRPLFKQDSKPIKSLQFVMAIIPFEVAGVISTHHLLDPNVTIKLHVSVIKQYN